MRIFINVLAVSLLMLLLIGNAPATAKKRSAKALKVIPEPTEMLYRDLDRSDKTCAKDPTVIRIGKSFHMYYSVPPYSEEKKAEGTRQARMVSASSTPLTSLCSVPKTRGRVAGPLMPRFIA